ncbi:hypothetical protein [Alteromonas phage JH01]|nr:hypothetical protein [Alteromonas phage JH01]
MIITEKKILREVERYRSTERIIAMKNRQSSFRELVDAHGLSKVALASGLTVTTLRQYLRTQSPNIGYEPLAQAQTVFGKFK